MHLSALVLDQLRAQPRAAIVNVRVFAYYRFALAAVVAVVLLSSGS